MYYLEPCSNSPELNKVIQDTLERDPAGDWFRTIEEAHAALDSFCDRKGFSLSDFNVEPVSPAGVR